MKFYEVKMVNGSGETVGCWLVEKADMPRLFNGGARCWDLRMPLCLQVDRSREHPKWMPDTEVRIRKVEWAQVWSENTMTEADFAFLVKEAA